MSFLVVAERLHDEEAVGQESEVADELHEACGKLGELGFGKQIAHFVLVGSQAIES